jgi:hypothetical protein
MLRFELQYVIKIIYIIYIKIIIYDYYCSEYELLHVIITHLSL